ncbi:methyltransferase domain-containing protein [Oscillatoria sp. FACHB-1406]|uniref:class I SAM-dependent methyltransferase n=1 Tax=Oscillatoria sp. FACHB-1406 TaxID=2692846 RepID=UPI0018EFBFDE|nr:methyltransferase domain-containing protein [Oscillatoria sp. FACHB-1406]
MLELTHCVRSKTQLGKPTEYFTLLAIVANSLNLNSYKQQIADLYSRRSPSYDEGDWHPRIARRLLEYTHLAPGQRILDIATGTGLIALEASPIVGSQGRVIGVDISEGMLEKAQRKVDALGFKNIELLLADAETLNFPEDYFDRVFCSSALIWMSDLTAALRLWHRFLKPGGLIGFHAFADTAFIGGVLSQKILQKYGVSLTLNQPTGTIEKCYELLKNAGFEAIKIEPEQYGSYVTFEYARRMWTGKDYPAPGQFPNPLARLSEIELQQAEREFETALKALQGDRGIWNDITIFFARGRKRI